MAGRPKFEITKEVIEEVEALAAQGLSQEQIGSVIGCSMVTVGRRKKDNEEFEAAIKRGQQKGSYLAAHFIFDLAHKLVDASGVIFVDIPQGLAAGDPTQAVPP